MFKNYKKKAEIIWLFGKNTCFTAMQNPNRTCYELKVTKNFFIQNKKILEKSSAAKNIKITEVSFDHLSKILPKNVNHQGIALSTSPWQTYTIEDIIEKAQNHNSTIVILDHITDIHNVGSCIRSAACFNVDAVVLTYDNSPSENSIMSKISCGAIDLVPVVYVVNIANTIKLLKENGYWCYGLDCKADSFLDHEKDFHTKKVLIFGSEEKGMRRLTKENCDKLIKIPISEKIDSLNVSNTVAITLFYINEILNE